MASSNSSKPPAGQRNMGAIIFRNTLAASAGSWFSKLAHFAFGIYAVRTLGEVDLGRYATIVALVGLFSVFVELGMAQYVERSIAQDASKAADLFWNLVVLRAMLALAGIAGITSIALLLYGSDIAVGAFLLSLTFLLSALLVPAMIVFTANERFDLATGMYMVGQTVTMGLGVILLWAGLGIYALLLTGFVGMPLQIVGALWLMRRYGLGPFPFKIAPNTWRSFIRASLPFGVTSLALTFNYNVDTVILGFFRDNAEVGWYNASYRLVFNAVGVVGAFLVVMTPSLAREHKLNPERVQAWVRTSIYWMIVFAVPAGAGLSLIAHDALPLLYGEAFANAGTVAAIIAWDIPLFVLLAFFGNVTAATGRERAAAKIYVGSAVANVVLNAIFIPMYGMYAAATITVFSDLVTAVLFFILLREMIVFHPRFTGLLARVGTATGLMAASIWLTGHLPLMVIIAVGGITYLLAAVVLRLINVSATFVGVRAVLRRLRPQRGAL